MLGRTRAREHHIACAFLLWAHVSFQLGTCFEAMQRLHLRGPHGHGTQVQSRWQKKVKPMQIWATLLLGNMGDITEGRAGSVGTSTSRGTTTCNGMVWDVLSKRKPAAPFLVGLKLLIIVALEALVVNILAPPLVPIPPFAASGLGELRKAYVAFTKQLPDMFGKVVADSSCSTSALAVCQQQLFMFDLSLGSMGGGIC